MLCQLIMTHLGHNIFMNNYEIVRNAFAERLRDLMEERNLSIKKFASLVKIPRTTVNSWLLKIKSPNIHYLCAIADFFGVTTDYLLGREY